MMLNQQRYSRFNNHADHLIKKIMVRTKKKMQEVYKPGFVACGHLSMEAVARFLKQSTRRLGEPRQRLL